MTILNVCKNYFNGFQEISNFIKNDNTTNVLAVLKVISYFTFVIPLSFALVQGTASLFGRISKKQDLSSHDKRVNDRAKTTFLKKDFASSKDIPSLEPSNHQLAEKIIAARGEGEKTVDFPFPPVTAEELFTDPQCFIEPIKKKMIERRDNPGKILDSIVINAGWCPGGFRFLDSLIKSKMIFSYALYKSSETGEIYAVKLGKDDKDPLYFSSHPENIYKQILKPID